jgi:hypothetical protein
LSLAAVQDPIFKGNKVPNTVQGYPGGIFDPLGFSKGNVMELQTKEVKNGRLAMVAFMGFVLQVGRGARGRVAGEVPVVEVQAGEGSRGLGAVGGWPARGGRWECVCGRAGGQTRSQGGRRGRLEGKTGAKNVWVGWQGRASEAECLKRRKDAQGMGCAVSWG